MTVGDIRCVACSQVLDIPRGQSPQQADQEHRPFCPERTPAAPMQGTVSIYLNGLVWVGDLSGFEMCSVPEYEVVKLFHRCGWSEKFVANGLDGTYLGNIISHAIDHAATHSPVQLNPWRLDRKEEE